MFYLSLLLLSNVFVCETCLHVSFLHVITQRRGFFFFGYDEQVRFLKKKKKIETFFLYIHTGVIITGRITVNSYIYIVVESQIHTGDGLSIDTPGVYQEKKTVFK